jgi:hypothetical protein
LHARYQQEHDKRGKCCCSSSIRILSAVAAAAGWRRSTMAEDEPVGVNPNDPDSQENFVKNSFLRFLET